ncbi:Flp pilus assembly complex ATPase component TadA [Achromobacter deleyi]|uniref:Flp pilus assembly complex ATPase component TadA n=1 Tax=Achromobacter deleyi TaxID=1353891 RepID=A0A7T4B2L5_9BURK|nr:ATPase, T2SS/T4P/T4SS family [Achromobacter deleyi]QQB34518.1 Flp pilus assembly complex ATPase component TadA [Achromobacter deleyi]
MLEIQMTFDDATTRKIVAAAPVLIGRGVHCDLRIANWRVGRQHARLRREASAVVLEDLGALGGTFVNGLRVARHVQVGPDDEILIGPCRLKVAPEREGGSNAAVPAALLPLSPPVREAAAAPLPVSSLPSLQWRRRLHAALLGALDLRRRDVAGMSDASLRAEAARLLTLIVAEDAGLPLAVDREALCREVLDEAVGLGPLEPLLAAPDVTEIMVNRHDEIYVEREGRLWRHAGAFTGEQSVRRVIERIVTPLGRRIDESSPMVDARLPDGSRVHAIIPPVALKGASLTIRKFPTRRPGMPDLLAAGALSEAMAQFLARCVRLRKNLVVSGGTGAGKTTLLNVLSNEIPEGERIVTIEDAAELRLSHEHLVSLEARPSNQEGRGRIDIRELVRNALRMRPDRIVVGECRGAEAFDMLTAMNTGHEGSLTTLHANSARDALARLESMVLMAGLDLPLAVVREHIAASIDIIVQQARLSDGRRVVVSVAEVTGMESGRIQLQELFRHARHGGFAGCGIVPSFAQASQEAGQALDVSWFAVDRVATGAGRAASLS